MLSLSPYLNFSGAAEKAAHFYAQVFGTKAQIMYFGENSMGADPTHVMHAQVPLPGGAVLMLADSRMTRTADGTDAVQVALSGDDLDAAHALVAKLSADGGTIHMPLEVQMWGDAYGQLTDKFGITWHINIHVNN